MCHRAWGIATLKGSGWQPRLIFACMIISTVLHLALWINE